MKNRIISIALAALTLAAMLVIPMNAAYPAGQIVFDESTDATLWAKQAASVVSYNNDEKAIEVHRQENASLFNGVNNDGNRDLFPEFVLNGDDGLKFVKIKIKTTNGYAPNSLLFHFGPTADGGTWAALSYKAGELSGLEDGNWHEFIFDLSGVKDGEAINVQQLMAFVGGEGNVIDIDANQSILFRYIAFFKTEDEAKAYTDPLEKKVETTTAAATTTAASTTAAATTTTTAAQTSDLTVLAVFALAISAAAIVVVSKKQSVR